MIELLTILQGFSPFAAIALALVIILQLISQKRSVDTLKENHIHELKDGLQNLDDTLKRIETKMDKMNDNITYIKARTNGKKNG